MKEIIKKGFIKIYLALFIVMSVVNTTYGEVSTIKNNDLYAKSALLLDADSLRVLYEKNGFEKLPMASTTKIMTCLVALENSNPEDIVEFSSYASSMPQVKLGASTGRKFKMKDLIYSLMLESHNDTAVAIAEKVGGSTTGFANMMNERAKKIGTTNTNFVTPNGLDDPMHYTTAYDLALIAAEAIKNPDFLKIIGTSSHSFSDIDGKTSYCVNNKDAFLSQMNGAFGIKTGFTGNAGYCFVGALRSNNRTFISVVLASGWPPSKTYKWQDTRKLMNYGINNFNYRVLFQNIDSYKKIPVTGGIGDCVDTYIEGNVSTLLSDNDKVEYIYNLQDNSKISAPVKKDDVIGYLQITINGEVYKKLPIKCRETVKEFNIKYAVKVVLHKFLP